MTTHQIKRPVLISILCIVGYVWTIVTFPGIFSPNIKKIGDFYPALLGLIVALTFISFVGVWHMKKWGVNLFISMAFIKTFFYLMIDQVSYFDIILSIIFFVILLLYYKKMDVNL